MKIKNRKTVKLGILRKRINVIAAWLGVLIIVILVVIVIPSPLTVNDIVTSKIVRTSDYPILNHGEEGEWDDLNIGCPQIIDIGGKRLMYYLGQKGGSAKLSVGIALLQKNTWVKYTYNPILISYDKWERSQFGILFGSIIKVKESYYLYYSTFPDKNNNIRGNIGVAISKDGFNWIKYKNNPIIAPNMGDEYHCCYPYVIENNGVYYMYYTVASYDNWWQPDTYKVAMSTDGLAWERKGIVMKAGVGQDTDVWIEGCSVYKCDDGYVLSYTGAGGSAGWCINFASNKLPIGMFTKSINNPSFTRSLDIGKFDEVIVATPYIYKDGKELNMLYQGASVGKYGYTYLSIGKARIVVNR